MKNILFVGKLRGFFKHLIEADIENICYEYEVKEYYEINSLKKERLKRIFNSRILDILGVILKIKRKKLNKKYDLVQTYNKFLVGNTPYIIIVENPTALYHYRLRRRKSFLGKNNLKKSLNDKNLKGIICISKACRNTIGESLNQDIPKFLNVTQIYPYIPMNKLVTEKSFTRVATGKIKCLFISSNFKLKSGKEILEVFKELNNNIELTIVTDIEKLDFKLKKYILQQKNIKLMNFDLQSDELSKLYEAHDILLHPTRQDSFALVVLEAIKAGLCIIATDLYAIPEMVKNEGNGYLIKCKYYFFNQEDNLPNEKVWNNREKTIYSDYIDENIVKELKIKIEYLEKNRNKLKKFKENSFEKARNGEFSEEMIKKRWRDFYGEIGV